MNFIVAVGIAVFCYPFLLRLQNEHQESNDNLYIRRAFSYWWASWIVWTFTWFFITFDQFIINRIKISVILGFSDLNGVFLILAYFTLTRENKYTKARAFALAVFLCFVLALGYLLLRVIFKDIAVEMQEKWSLCLAMISPVLIGWAILLRYNVRSSLTVGYIYGFAQPAAFLAALPYDNKATLIQHKAVILLALAIMKTVWAVVVTRGFFMKPIEGGSLIREPKDSHVELTPARKESLSGSGATASEKLKHISIFDKRWKVLLVIQTVLLFSAISLVVYMYQGATAKPFLIMFGLILGIGTLAATLDGIWKIVERFFSKPRK